MSDPEDEGWVLLGYTDCARVYDANGDEIPLDPWVPVPEGVEIGDVKVYYRPAPVEEAV